jgi:hypothetical protein
MSPRSGPTTEAGYGRRDGIVLMLEVRGGPLFDPLSVFVRLIAWPLGASFNAVQCRQVAKSPTPRHRAMFNAQFLMMANFYKIRVTKSS